MVRKLLPKPHFRVGKTRLGVTLLRWPMLMQTCLLIIALRDRKSAVVMNASTERKVIRWLHIIISIPVIGYIYGPVSQIPQAVIVVRWIIFPIIVLSGLWLWKGSAVKRWFRQ